MSNVKNTFRINWFIGCLAILSSGVLLGCDYCSPLLLAGITAAIAYRMVKRLNSSMHIYPCNK